MVEFWRRHGIFASPFASKWFLIHLRNFVKLDRSCIHSQKWINKSYYQLYRDNDYVFFPYVASKSSAVFWNWRVLIRDFSSSNLIWQKIYASIIYVLFPPEKNHLRNHCKKKVKMCSLAISQSSTLNIDTIIKYNIKILTR